MKKVALVAIGVFLLAGCSSPETVTKLRLATHDSFYISDEQIAEFESSTGYDLEVITLGDTGGLTNQLVLTKAAPVADVVYGIDNTFAPVATENKIVEDLVPINYGDVCFNYDIDWFDANGIQPPTSWRELGDPRFKNLVVIPNPTLSSPGLAFLATTHAGFETSAEVFAYWRSLRDNGLKTTSDWTEAYFTHFTRYEGERPIVLSYASSPAAEIKNGVAGSAALRTECFRQTEYASAVVGGSNPAGAKALIDFFLTESFQSQLPWNMFVYPVADVELPQEFAQFAAPAESTIGENLDIAANREQWLTDWQDVFDN
ncbi:thiamine ABC transporter substrate-binding protein [Aquiluna borgnonia]|uniref:Thiamine ABC transporter substrate-binding protein n=1 Tax=Aquiluna borgnonia TaxID=2499157 RepID=A0A7D4PY46_9MICO|nr:thiamine ABC transporter substrate-binding protein [Aquiluna borgnonia]QKJ25844.1 thiamine ABC transporter substrate-binding protein [Aquiluna borgnonia]